MISYKKFKKKIIPLEECKHNWLYMLDCRNAKIGIFDSTKKGFVIRRQKFGDIFTFIEYHYDYDYTVGTARPLEAIEECTCSVLRTDTEILEYLERRHNELYLNVGNRTDSHVDFHYTVDEL